MKVILLLLSKGKPCTWIECDSREDAALVLIRQNSTNGYIANKIANPEFVVPTTFHLLETTTSEKQPHDEWWICAAGDDDSEDDLDT